jgi:Flp pilus assembly protein TadG
MHLRQRDGETGNAALELVVLAPILLLLISLAVAAGRTSIALGSVQAAARDAARQASISRTPGAASLAAVSSAAAELSEENLDCVPGPVVTPHVASGFAVPVGLPATVSVTVSCTVPLSDLLLPGAPGHKTLTASFTSPLDPYRGR